MQGVDISGLDRAQQFECLYPGDHWGPGQATLAHTDQSDRNTPGDTLLPSPALSSITSPQHSLLSCLSSDKVTE